MPVWAAVASGVNGSLSVSQPIHAVGVPAHPGEIDEVLGEHHLQQREQQKGIRVGNDAEPFERDGGLGSAGIDDHHASTALDDVVHAVLDPRRSEETAVGDNRIGAHHHQEVGARQIGYRDRGRHAVEQLARDQPAVGVLR